METEHLQSSASALEKGVYETSSHLNENVLVKSVEIDDDDDEMGPCQKDCEQQHLTKKTVKVRRTKSMTVSKIARSSSIKKSNSMKRTSSMNKRESASLSNQSIVDEKDDSNGPVRKPSITGELNKYEKSRVRRRSSLGSYEMGGPMFAFQRRELLSSKKQDSSEINDKIELSRKKKFKIMILGDSGVGKSALLTRFAGANWPLSNTPDVIAEPIEVETENTIVEMWDTSGRKEYDNIRQFTFLRSKVFLTCFSLNDRDSLNNVIMKWIPMARNWSKTALVVMVCMKIDLRDEANPTASKSPNDVLKSFEWREKAKEMDITCLECSSKYPIDILLQDLDEIITNHFDKSN